MELRQLEVLTAVADHRSFTAAAEALLTVQSNVSTHVRRLEQELSVVLVDRSSGRLTEHGQMVVERARRIQSEAEALREEAAQANGHVTGTVRLGAGGNTGCWLMPRFTSLLAVRYPQLNLRLVEAPTATLLAELTSGHLDLAIVATPVPGPDVAATPLYDEEFMLIAPALHPLAGKSIVSLEDFDGLPVILPPRGSIFRELFEGAAQPLGVHLHSTLEVDGVRMAAAIAFEGHLPAVVPATVSIPTMACLSRIQAVAHPWVRIPIEGVQPAIIGVARRIRPALSSASRVCIALLDEAVSLTAPTGVVHRETDHRHPLSGPPIQPSVRRR